MYATMRPEFVTDGDTIRLRGPDDPVPIKQPEVDDDLFRVLHGPNRGTWSWAYTVDYERMRVASINAPVPLVQILGLDHETDATVEVNGERSITVRWVANDLRVHTGTGFKTLCQSLGAVDGDEIVLAFPGGLAATAQLRHAPDPAAGPADQILHRIGGGTVETLLDDLAYAVGFDGAIDVDVTVDDLLSRLSERRDGRLIELLLAVHPELTD
jgi:hypothetical protein